MYKGGHSYAAIGREFNVSRQRIHMIVANYTNSGRKGRKRKYKNFKDCKVCGEPAIALHHKDLDNSNDSKRNLLAVCGSCHKKIHLLKKWSRKYDSCQMCGTKDSPHDSRGVCTSCLRIVQYEKKRKFRYEWSRNYPCCQMCRTKKIKHSSRGLCHNCEALFIYYEGGWVK